jgi:CRISPR-associated exonuclease Cas4
LTNGQTRSNTEKPIGHTPMGFSMESYIQISKINDFLYSPQSLYLHSVYEAFNQDMYHETPQKVGKINHQNIEEGIYSSAKRYLQGLAVYSDKYNFGGKIDIFDTNAGLLVERKTRIKKIHDGHRYQLYAQKIALEETGYVVHAMAVHSLEDNRRYHIPLPDVRELANFEEVLRDMRTYNAQRHDPNVYRCNLSVYRHLSY